MKEKQQGGMVFAQQEHDSGRNRGIWVACEGPGRFLSLSAEKSGLSAIINRVKPTDVFLQVFRQGRCFFDSGFFESCSGSDLLSGLISDLKSQGIKVHAWLNICNLGTNPSGQLVTFLGSEQSFLRDNFANTSLSGARAGTIDSPGLWIDPSNPKLAEVIRILMAELSAFNFDGIHLDFIRYPYYLPIKPASWIKAGVDFGYSADSLSRFLDGRNFTDYFENSADFGVVPNSENSGQEFDDWRRSQISNLLQLFRSNFAENKQLSVAALPWSDRAYLNACQNWPGWAEQGILDSLCLMTYTSDNQYLRQQLKQARAFLQPGQSLFAGIGLYKFDSEAELDRQLQTIAELNFAPCFFSADSFLNPPFDQWAAT